MPTSSGPTLQCQSCGERFPLDSSLWKCHCGGVIDIVGTSPFPRDALAQRPHNFWRYREALAITQTSDIVSLGEVMTPLLSTRFRHWNVSFKLEYLLPTGSYKDRGIAICINHLKSLGVPAVSEDSSGNAGASTAAYTAAAGITANVYVPQTTSASKINQIRMYGAQCHLVPGARPNSALKAQESQEGVRYIGHSWNPFFACGVKSVAYEIAEQSDWDPPDWVVTPAGGGSLVMGLIDGFTELRDWGYISKLPKILVLQAESCSPIYNAWSNGSLTVTGVTSSPTLAEGVALPDPARGDQVLKSIRNYGATMMVVDEKELLSSWKDMAKMGILIEPTSALAVAGAWLARGPVNNIINPQERTVILLTGHGLKTKASLIDEIFERDGEM